MGQSSDYDRFSLTGLAVHGGDVTPEEAVLLMRLAEEAGEIVQAVSKTLRWGWSSCHPKDRRSEQNRQTNERLVLAEVSDLLDLTNRLARLCRWSRIVSTEPGQLEGRIVYCTHDDAERFKRSVARSGDDTGGSEND